MAASPPFGVNVTAIETGSRLCAASAFLPAADGLIVSSRAPPAVAVARAVPKVKRTFLRMRLPCFLTVTARVAVAVAVRVPGPARSSTSVIERSAADDRAQQREGVGGFVAPEGGLGLTIGAGAGGV